MSDRIAEEVALMRTRYPELEYLQLGHWVRIPRFRLPAGWGRPEISLAFQFPPSGYPQNPFYGFYVPTGLRFGSAVPRNFTDPAPAQPPFRDLIWAMFSGNPEPWNPSPQIQSGTNGLSWLHSIYARLEEGVGNG